MARQKGNLKTKNAEIFKDCNLMGMIVKKEAMQYPGVIEKKSLMEVISTVLEKLAASPKERPNAMFRRVKSLIGQYRTKPGAIGKSVSAPRKLSIASKWSRVESLSGDFIQEEAALSDVTRTIGQRFVYGSETSTQEDLAALAGLKENEELPSPLRQAAAEVFASREVLTGEPSPQELEAINTEVLRRGREFLQNHHSAGHGQGLSDMRRV